MHSSSSSLPLLLLSITLFSLVRHTTSNPGSSTCNDRGDVNRWCATTPHPEPCRYFLHNPPAGPGHPWSRSDFYRASVALAYGLTLRAQTHLKHLGKQCRTEQQRTAYLDCWRLYANTVVQLNRTVNSPSGTCAPVDAQTWLSAALTNLEACRKGFHDIGETFEIIQPVMKYNLSELISNCLAINKAYVGSANLTAMSPPLTSAGARRLLQLSRRADAVVAADGSGNFRFIKQALDLAAAVMRNRVNSRFVIYVKAGIYNENVIIVNSLKNITMIGDGKGRTIITGSRSVARGFTTFSSPTFSVFGDGFIATGITFRNTFGPGSQAVALLSGSDRSIFYRCSFEGYQDTLCVFSQRQFYRECDIYGTIDIIFGNAAAVLQNCNILPRRPRIGESNVITAQGRTDPNQNTGIVIQFSRIRPAPDLFPVRHVVSTFLGRPWQQYSRTVYMQNFIDSFINPAGWLPSNGNFALNTLFYAEFRNTGPGSRMSRRVRWRGYHVIVRPSFVKQFTVDNFIAGRTWIPSARIPFSSGF